MKRKRQENDHPLRNHTSNPKKKKLPPSTRKLFVPKKKCPECRKDIEPKSGGNRCCTSCGLVLQTQIICEQSEWRTFADNDRGGPDPNRVGSVQHYLLQQTGDLSTAIGSGYGAKLSNVQT
eukprot:407666_1